MSSFQIVLSDSQGDYQADLVYMPEGTGAANSINFQGKIYAIFASDEALPKVIKILSALYSEARITTKLPISQISSDNPRLALLSSRVAQVATSATPSQHPWMTQDIQLLADLKPRFAEEYLAKKGLKPEGLKGFLLHGTHQKSAIHDFEKAFDTAVQEKSVERLLPLLAHVDLFELIAVIEEENLATLVNAPNLFSFPDEKLGELDDYMNDRGVGFSGIVCLRDAHRTSTLATAGIDPKVPFAIHSIGKVFTEILAIELLRKGLLPYKLLYEPIQLAPEVMALLPKEVQSHLREKKPTLLECMQHKSGLGDYLSSYSQALAKAVLLGSRPPVMVRPEDFLQFAEKTTGERGKNHYSNLGLLLVGLSLQYHTRTPFATLLQTHVLDPANVHTFASKMPKNARVNPDDPIAPYIAASPAGGYFSTAQDFINFGSWISSKWKDPTFKQLIEQYGGEFYSEGEIHHSGGIYSSSAFLSIFPEKEVTIAILSDTNQPGAKELYQAIRNHMLQQ